MWLLDRRPGRAVCRLSNSWAGEGHGRRGQRARRRRFLGRDRLPGEVGLKEGTVQNLHRVRLPDQPLGLVGSEWRLDAPQVNTDTEGLRGLHRGHHVLVPGDQHGIGNRAVPGQRLHVRADLRVHAFLLAARVQVAQAQLDPRHLCDHALVDGGHTVPGGVIPVHAEQFAPDLVVGVPGEGLDELVRIDPVLAPGGGAEQQLPGGGVDVPDVDHDCVSGKCRERWGSLGHGTLDSTAGQAAVRSGGGLAPGAAQSHSRSRSGWVRGRPGPRL